jgi:hypothetical protein
LLFFGNGYGYGIEAGAGYGYGYDLPALLRKALQAGARIGFGVRFGVVDYITTSLVLAFSHFHIPHSHIHLNSQLLIVYLLFTNYYFCQPPTINRQPSTANHQPTHRLFANYYFCQPSTHRLLWLERTSSIYGTYGKKPHKDTSPTQSFL